MNKQHCYKGEAAIKMEPPPIRLVIGTIALRKHMTHIWAEHCRRLDHELDELKLDIPLEYNHLIQFDKGYSEGRELILEEAKRWKATHLFFLDSDTFIPAGAIKSILQTAINQDYKVICLPVYLKRMPLISNIYQDAMFAPLSKLPKSLFKIDLTGLAACLIDLEVFSKITQPYFKGEWKVVSANNINFHLKTGEDCAFFYKLKRCGIDVYCEPRFICDHYDQDKDIFYPSLLGKKEVCYDV